MAKGVEADPILLPRLVGEIDHPLTQECQHQQTAVRQRAMQFKEPSGCMVGEVGENRYCIDQREEPVGERQARFLAAGHRVERRV